MKPTIMTTLVACAVALPIGAANAAYVKTSVDYSGLKFEVIDLTPNDGIDAGFTLTGSQSRLTLQAFDAAGKLLDERRQTVQGTTVPTTVLQGHGKYLDVSAGDGAGSLNALNGANRLDGSGKAQLVTTWSFDLAPGTALLFTGQVDTAMSRADGYHNMKLGGGASLRANAGLWLPFEEYQSATDFAGYDWAYGPDVPHTDYLGLTLLNIGASTVRGTLDLTATASFYSRVGDTAPIPEPATYLMLGTGLLIAGVAARRRRAA